MKNDPLRNVILLNVWYSINWDFYHCYINITATFFSVRICCFSLFYIFVNWISFGFWTVGGRKQDIWRRHLGLWEAVMDVFHCSLKNLIINRSQDSENIFEFHAVQHSHLFMCNISYYSSIYYTYFNWYTLPFYINVLIKCLSWDIMLLYIETYS